jgi:hypothetical protein
MNTQNTLTLFFEYARKLLGHVSGEENMKKSLMLGGAFFMLFIFTGCGGGKEKLTDGPVAMQAPEWVNKGSGAFEDADGKKVFYGVGMITGVKDRSLAIQAADQRARAEIAKSLDNYIFVLVKDYMVSTGAMDMQGPAEEQDISIALKGATKMTLKGSVIIGHWKDITDNTMFSLARLKVDDITEDLNQSQEIDDKLRDFVRANSDNAFDELASAESM